MEVALLQSSRAIGSRSRLLRRVKQLARWFFFAGYTSTTLLLLSWSFSPGSAHTILHQTSPLPSPRTLGNARGSTRGASVIVGHSTPYLRGRTRLLQDRRLGVGSAPDTRVEDGSRRHQLYMSISSRYPGRRCPSPEARSRVVRTTPDTRHRIARIGYGREEAHDGERTFLPPAAGFGAHESRAAVTAP